MQEIKIIDGFIFAVIDEETAKDRLKNCKCIYRLYSDDTEILIQDENELNDTIIENDKIGVEIGNLNQNKEHFNRISKLLKIEKTFDQWLDDKINLILE